MFIRPNEFEAQLAAAKAVAPVYKKSHHVIGAAVLLILGAATITWLALLSCWLAAAALTRAAIHLGRLMRDAADFGSWLVLR